MKNEGKRLILVWFSFYNLFGAWKIVGIHKNKYKAYMSVTVSVVYSLQ